MCLTTTNPEIKIAEDDIICFKTSYSRYVDKCFVSAIRGFYYDINVVQEKVEVNAIKDKSLDHGKEQVNPLYMVEGGYHSYVKLEDSIRIGYEYSGVFIIPKGTKYIEGFDNVTDTQTRISEVIIYHNCYLKYWLSQQSTWKRIITKTKIYLGCNTKKLMGIS